MPSHNVSKTTVSKEIFTSLLKINLAKLKKKNKITENRRRSRFHDRSTSYNKIMTNTIFGLDNSCLGGPWKRRRVRVNVVAVVRVTGLCTLSP